MYSYGYFTAPTNDNANPFCQKCTSSYGCVCDLLIQYGHCPICMNIPHRCLCKELSTPQTVLPNTVVEPRWVPTATPSSFRGNYVNLLWEPRLQRMDPVAQQAKEMLEQLQQLTQIKQKLMATATATATATAPAPAPAPTPTPIPFNIPVVKDSAKWTMNYFWKEACKAEGVPFTRKEHCAYPRVLATYHRLRKEYDERDEKLMKERSSGW